MTTTLSFEWCVGFSASAAAINDARVYVTVQWTHFEQQINRTVSAIAILEKKNWRKYNDLPYSIGRP